jgi:carbamoyltransferase
MKILSLNLSHNASCTIVEDGKIILSVEEERLSKVKADSNIKNICNLLKNNFFDYVYYTSYNISINKKEFYESYVKNELSKNNISYNEIHEFSNHHLTHAFSAFYNSGFDEAVCLIIDNGGLALKKDDIELGQEILSIIKLKNGEETENLFKICRNETGKNINFNNVLYSINTISIPGIYDVSKKIFKYSEAGSIMGLSCYGKENNIYNTFEIIENYFNINTYFIGALLFDSNIKKEDFCYTIQKDCTNLVHHYLNMIKQKYPNTPICVSGGFFQNCVANYQFLKRGIDIFVDPISHDGGTSIGLAQYAYIKHSKDNKVNKYSNLYLGPNINYLETDFNKISLSNSKLNIKNVSIKDVALLLKKRKSVAIFQGRSEIGPRALGNRSILFDPSDPYAKEKINLIKNREWFRPYAGTVLDEHKHEWFDLSLKNSTDYMSYALDVKEDKRKFIPGICHIDNTCRAQTLKKQDNIIFYNLIKEFYDLTSIPILLNTSLNTSGKPLVEDLNDLLEFLISTSVDYVYLPEKETILFK